MINILLSGYNFGEEWAKETIKKYISSEDKIVVIPFAFSEAWINSSNEWDNAYSREYGKYYRELIKPFGEIGVSEDNITWINFFKDKKEDMKKAIDESDVVFFTGGLPDRAVERVLDKGLLNYISKAKIVMGASAGALMQLKDYHISPDEDYSEFSYQSGLGLIKSNFYIEVHYEDTEVQYSCIKEVLKEKTDTVYAIKEQGGIILDDDKLILLGDVTTYQNN